MAEAALSIDFETCSPVDLRRTGIGPYVEDPDTRVICMAYRFPGQLTRLWHNDGSQLPPSVDYWVRMGKPVAGWNVAFEWAVWNTVLRRQQPALFAMMVEQCRDTMAQAAYWGLPLSLDTAAKALPALGVKKDEDGRRLMMRMARPRTEENGAYRWWHEEDPEKRDRLGAYCMVDVDTEAGIADLLPPLPPTEVLTWQMDLRANWRGIALDRDLVRAMKKIAADEKKRLDSDLFCHTGISSTNKNAELLAFAQRHHPEIDSLAKDRLPKLLERTDLDPRVRAALEIRQEAAKSSVAKLDAMRRYARPSDGRMCFLVQYYGAFRTGRWAGRGPQVQNYPRSLVKDQAALVRALKAGMDAEGLDLFFGVTPLTALSSALRGCLTVLKGSCFAAVDFSQIEARVIAWLAGEQHVLDAFRTGKDLYKVAAAAIYGVSYDAVTKDQRQIGKVAVLALGYQGGVGAFQTMAKVYGVEVTDEEADKIKVDWRNGHSRIKRLWYAVQEAALTALQRPGPVVIVGGADRPIIRFKGWADPKAPGEVHLVIELPSGRTLTYRDAKIEPGTYGDQISYMGIDQYTKKWTRIPTYGGKLVENITQAVARDVLRDALLRVETSFWPSQVALLGSVHDEGLFELKDRSYFSALCAVMKKVPPWASGLPVDADGYVSDRFRKD